MDFLFQLPFWLGICLITIIIVSTGLLTVTISKSLISKHLNKQHERVGRLLFRVTAGLIALLLSLSYANERIEQNKLRDSMELEASLVINVFIKLNLYDLPESDAIRSKMVEFIELTLKDDWKTVKANPFFSTTSETIGDAVKMAYNLPEPDKVHSKIKSDIILDLNEIAKLMQVRIYSQRTMTPYLMYILCFGLLFMWMFYSVYNLNRVALIFLSLYNAFIAILIYFIFMISNPLVGDLKMNHDSFDIIKTKGVDKAKE